MQFRHLNEGWNAEPNTPDPRVQESASTVKLCFLLNPFAYEAAEEEVGCLTFDGCAVWRLGPTNDEGWYRGQCRYSNSAPAWGEFYELVGDDTQMLEPTDWHTPPAAGSGARHFLFYLRDQTFECLASDWKFERGIAPENGGTNA